MPTPRLSPPDTSARTTRTADPAGSAPEEASEADREAGATVASISRLEQAN